VSYPTRPGYELKRACQFLCRGPNICNVQDNAITACGNKSGIGNKEKRKTERREIGRVKI
jgi:hypothetical protein